MFSVEKLDSKERGPGQFLNGKRGQVSRNSETVSTGCGYEVDVNSPSIKQRTGREHRSQSHEWKSQMCLQLPLWKQLFPALSRTGKLP